MKVALNHKKLKEVRENSHLTQEQLAEMAQISDRHIRNLESAQADPSSTVLCRISRVLDITMDELMAIEK